MEYTKIENPAEVASESLRNEARQKEEIAFQREMSVEEFKALSLRKMAPNTNNLDKLQDDAKVARREADVYLKAAKLGKVDVAEVHRAYLHRWLEHVERNHIQHSALLKVRAELGEPTADYDSVLAGLDVAHDLALSKLKELDGNKLSQSERKTAPRSRRVQKR